VSCHQIKDSMVIAIGHNRVCYWTQSCVLIETHQMRQIWIWYCSPYLYDEQYIFL